MKLFLVLIFLGSVVHAGAVDKIFSIGSDLGEDGKTYLYRMNKFEVTQGVCENGKPVLPSNCRGNEKRMGLVAFEKEISEGVATDIEKLETYVHEYYEQIRQIGIRLNEKPDPDLVKQKKILEEELNQAIDKLELAKKERNALNETMSKLKAEIIYLVKGDTSLYPEVRPFVKRFEKIFGGVGPHSENEMVAAGGGFTCGLMRGMVKCWGTDAQGVTEVPPLRNPRQISAGDFHACAIDDDGVKCWGHFTGGQTNVPFLRKPRQVSAGKYNTCALDEDGVKCWGDNSKGQRNVPTLRNPSQISVGKYLSCAVADENVKCWGESPISQIPDVQKPMELSVGDDHACVLDAEGVKCWGNNEFGKATVPALENPTQISAGASQTCALDAGKVKCWGDNKYGQMNLPHFRRPIQISSGGAHVCALDDHGIKCWGFNKVGQTDVPPEFIKH